MLYNSQSYLDYYHKLYDNNQSKKANKILLQIQKSKQAWKIAEQLMLDQKNHVHGSQLLSNKLNQDLPENINPQILTQFILTLNYKSNIHWLCLAKIFIHTHRNINKLQITGGLPVDIKLNILKQIPYGLTQMKVMFQGIQSLQYKQQIFNQNKQLILQTMRFLSNKSFLLQSKINQNQQQTLQNIVIQTLQNYSQNKVNFGNQQIVLFILNHKNIDKTVTLIQYVMLQQKYPQLQFIYQQFLQKNIKSNPEWMRPIYINFYTQQNIYDKLDKLKLKLVIQNVIKFMMLNSQQSFRTILSDSFQFWSKMAQKLGISYEKNIVQLNDELQKANIMKLALMQLFNILCHHSQLKKCPLQVVKSINFKLDIINIDQNQDLQQIQNFNKNQKDEFYELNYQINQIRNLSCDFFIQIFESIKRDTQSQKFLYEKLYILATQTQNQALQQIQLAIFIIDILCDYLSEDKDIQYLSALIEIILKQTNKLNQFICSRIIILLGKIDKIITSNRNLQIVHLVLQFFSKVIFYQKLSISASQSFLQLMQSYQTSNQIKSLQFKQKTQNYLNLWFESFYSQNNVKSEKVIQNITKALTIFIYKFKGSQFYAQFLQLLQFKINQFTDQDYKFRCIQAVISAQCWINSKQNQDLKNNPSRVTDYLVLYSHFIFKFIQLIYNRCINSNNRQKFSKSISLFSWAIKAGCYYVQIYQWLTIIKSLIQKTLYLVDRNNRIQNININPIVLTLIVSLLKSNIKQNTHVVVIHQFLQQLLPLINSILINNYQKMNINLQGKKSNYSLIKYVLQINNLYMTFNINNKMNIKMNPQQIFQFICMKIFENKIFWEYQVMKQSLIFLSLLTKINYQIEKICIQAIKIAPRTYQILWVQTENIFYNLYQKKGINIFQTAFQLIHRDILDPNPLFSLLKQSLIRCDKKMLKHFIRCL